MSAIDRRPQPARIEAWDDTGLERLQENFDALFGDNLRGFRLAELEAELAELATGRSYLVTADDGTLSVQSTAIPVSDGGTGHTTYVVGDILYADTTTSLARLADVATGNALISGGVGVAPSWGKIGLTTHVSGDLPYANLTQATAASKLLGRGSAAGGGDWEEITIGARLTMSGTSLSADVQAGTPGGADTQVQFNDGGVFGGDAGLVYNKTTDLLTAGAVTTTGDLTVGDNLVLSISGPHAIGGVTAANIGVRFTGTFSPTSAGNGIYASYSPVLNAVADLEAYVQLNAGQINEASSGNHALLAQVKMSSPTGNAGGATVTNAATLYIDSAPSFTVTGANYALWVDAGESRFDGNVTVNGSELVVPSGDIGIGTDAPNVGGFSRAFTVRADADGTVVGTEWIAKRTSDAAIAEMAFANIVGSTPDYIAIIRAKRSGANDAGALSFLTQATGGGEQEQLNITPTGVVELLKGQLAFPASQNASANANTLDDYEEGTWTPTMSFGGSSTGVTYSAQTGNYVKVGLLVFITGNVTLTSNGTGTGTARITGFPFQFSGGHALGGAMIDAGGSGTLNGLKIQGQVNTTEAIVWLESTTNAANATDTNITDTASIAFYIFHKAPS